ncbi:MAG TPA: hypothetical protein VGI75_05645, partial [Pirellulales bacterium]
MLILNVSFNQATAQSTSSIKNTAAATNTQSQIAKTKDPQPEALKPKPDFDALKLRIVPQKTDDSDIARRLVKPGHWTAATEETQANNFDFIGQLAAESRDEASGPPSQIDHTAYRLSITRPAALAKAQPKFLELMFFVPRDVPQPWLATELRNRDGSVAATPGPEPLSLLKPHQFNLIVLAADPDRYHRLEQLDSVLAPHSSVDPEEPLAEALQYYQIITPPLKQPLPLPSNSLAWTSIAYIIWDDVDPSLLSANQQRSLLDWLEWGGQLIISGPKSLDQLRGQNFLGPYLPALAGDSISIDAEMLKPLNHQWTLPVNGQQGRPLAADTSWSGVKLLPQNRSRSLVDAGGNTSTSLVIENRVGRGRVVVTAFRLTQRELWNWPDFDGFFNAFLLRRQPRRFSQSPNLAGLAVDWAWNLSNPIDPELVSRLVYLSRDPTLEEINVPSYPAQQVANSSINVHSRTNPNPSQPLTGNGDYFPRPLRDRAAWNDGSAISAAARNILREASGIVIPKASFVVRVLALYLVILVPINWFVFRAIGRVEWAWIAAPLIAIAGMAAVVKLAQLDIGFARSQSEVAVLELQGNYPRGHLTRYTAVYTSLSTTYDAHAENSGTLILPFPADPNFALLPGQSTDTVTYHCEAPIQLTDFAVASNSTQFLHSEQMLDLGGELEYVPAKADDSQGSTITNHTKQALQRVAVLRRASESESPPGEFETAWIGDLADGQSTDLKFDRTNAQQFAQLLSRWSFAVNGA